MTLQQTLKELESLSNEKVRSRNKKNGASDNQFGVQLGDIRKLSEKILGAKTKTNHELALELWKTENIDSRLLAILLIDLKKLSSKELDSMVRSANFAQLADWLNAYIVKQHPDKETLRQKWMKDKNSWAARAGWSLTAGRIAKNPEGLDIPALLERIETEMPKAASEVQWTMNTCLAYIGIHFPKLRKQAITVGETLGIYRDYPVSKGCTSPFAPIWINEMVKRNG
jgi:3-methyladenine DNA glycosylase AlkD